MNKSLEISGVRIDGFSLEEIINQIDNSIASGKKLQICVTNVYSFVLMQRDEEFKQANNSSLVIADGMPLVWVSRLLGGPLLERIAGSDLFYSLCRAASRKQYRSFFLGATDEVLRDLCKNLKKEFPGLGIAGLYAPPFRQEFSDEENKAMIERINSSGAEILWVGMTAPKQEKWIYQNLAKLDVKAAIGIGAAFDFFAGRVERAPHWMQDLGLEWLFRLTKEPKRLWKRYLIGNMVFVWLIAKEFLKRCFLKKEL